MMAGREIHTTGKFPGVWDQALLMGLGFRVGALWAV